jgi:hypothetical protein
MTKFFADIIIIPHLSMLSAIAVYINLTAGKTARARGARGGVYMISKWFISKAPVLLALGAALIFGACPDVTVPVVDTPVDALDLTALLAKPVADAEPVAVINGTQYAGSGRERTGQR